MIEVKRGDLLKENADALVNAVNCVGVMGRGIALQFRKAFPENFEFYQAACRRCELQPGRVLIFDRGRGTNPRFLINFPTKRHWREQSQIADIEAGFKSLVEEATRLGIRSMAVPPLGCGLGGLKWSDVRPRIEKAFTSLPDVRVLLFEPHEIAISETTPKRNLSEHPV